MFLNNKYTKYYFNIINMARTNLNESGYFEKHHIIPKCIGGTNDSDNIIKLTAREHFVCHRLLTKMVEGEFKYKLTYASWQLGRSLKLKNIKITNRIYEQLKINLSESMKGRKRKPFSIETKMKMSKSRTGKLNPMYNKTHSEDSKGKISKGKKGKKIGKENSFYGKTHSEDFKKIQSKLMSERMKGIPKKKSPCVYCGMFVAPNMMMRFHGEKCKKKN